MKTAWEKYTEEEKTQVFAFAEEYKSFISECKTERECVRKAVEILKAHGYRDLAEYEKSGETLCAGDKVYANNRGKSLCAFVVGEKPFKEGIRLLGAHIDSPRLTCHFEAFSVFSACTNKYFAQNTCRTTTFS